MDAEVTLESPSGGVTFVAEQPLGPDAASFERPSKIRADMSLGVQLADGSLNRGFGLSFSIDDLNATESVLNASHEDLQAYDARDHWYDGSTIRRDLIIRVVEGKLSGELREIRPKPTNGEEMNFPDVTAAQFSCE